MNQLGMNKLIYDKSLKIAVKKNPTITSISNYEAGQICLNKLKWLKGESASLDYKLKISPMSNYQRYLLAAFLSKKKKEILDREQKKYISPCPCFGDEEIFGLLSNDCISLTFSSFESELLDCIKENIISFFVYNNFGFRQSKGFGCFSVIKINDEDIEETKKITILKNSHKYVYSKSITNDLKKIFNTINSDYQLLKSGRNFDKYQKSKLFEYMKDEHHLRWEKRKIKLFLKNNHSDVFNDLKYEIVNYNCNRIEGGDEQENERFVFARALLGLAEHIEFTTFENRGYNKDKVKIKMSEVSGLIDRFKSPLTFKVYDNNIYIIVDEIDEEMFNANFSFTLSYEKNQNRFEEYLFGLNTPTFNQFDLIEFLDSKLTLLGWKKIL
ncbi:hypothetical protein AGMMS50239_15970 [Bacteroidia bacterium]|nr:hypothetical protein AGMMS50239_15970 [Bacteroidia bacterium]